MKMITPLLEECWATNPCQRLTIVRLRKRIQNISLLVVDFDNNVDYGEDGKTFIKVEST